MAETRGIDLQPRASYAKHGKSRLNGEQNPEYFKSYYEQNKERILARNKEARKRRQAAGIKNRVTSATWRFMVLSLLRERDGDCCGICKKTLDFSDLTNIHIDHKIPYWISKDDSAQNIRLTHKTCNITRSRKNVEKTLDQ